MKLDLHSKVQNLCALCAFYLGRSMSRQAAMMPKMKNLNFLYHESVLYGWQMPRYRSAAIARQEYVDPGI